MGEGNTLGIDPELYSCRFWIRLCRKGADEIFSRAKVENFNKVNFKAGHIFNVFNSKEEISRQELIAMIKKVSRVPEEIRYKDGKVVSSDYYEELMKNINYSGIEDCVSIRYGMTVRRGEIRSFPTEDRVFQNPTEYALDRFMESAVYTCEPCVIYSTSKDGKWYFIRTYYYSGWVRVADVAVSDKRTIQDYCGSRDFIVVTGKRIYLGYNHFNKDVSYVPVDMGVRLAIIPKWDNDILVGDMYAEGNYVAVYPIRDEEGTLRFVNVLIPVSEDVSLGYLKCTRHNVLRQVFKLQGERYGWGGEFGCRDCSSLIMDVFRCFGIMLPRNSGDQLDNSTGRTVIFSDNADQMIKLRMLSKAKPGELIYLKGHVAMFIGKYEDNYYIIHDTVGVHRVVNDEGLKEYIPVNGVTVSNLKDIYTSTGMQYIDGIIGMKNIFQ